MAGIILQLAPHAEVYIARVFESGTFNSGTGVTTRIAKVIDKTLTSMTYALMSSRLCVTRQTFGR